MKIRKEEDRGKFENEWLKARYTFSFSHYYDSSHMGFHHLRVINNDIIAPAGGFPTHSHKDMEILTFILSGELAHKDSMGNSAVIKPGMIQIMSAGSGVTHSEFNPSNESLTELFQVWLVPKVKNIAPSYSEYSYDFDLKNELTLIASGDAKDNVGFVNQDVQIYFFDNENTNISLSKENNYWLQLIDGEIKIEGSKFSSRDGLGFEKEEVLVEIKKARGILFKMLL